MAEIGCRLNLSSIPSPAAGPASPSPGKDCPFHLPCLFVIQWGKKINRKMLRYKASCLVMMMVGSGVSSAALLSVMNLGDWVSSAFFLSTCVGERESAYLWLQQS